MRRHRITVVTTSSDVSSTMISSARMSPDVTKRSLIPGSPVPGLEAASDCSSGGEPTTPVSRQSTDSKRPANVSSWRRRGLHSLAAPETPSMGMDLSQMKRRDFPIKLVVDDPMPVGKYYGDPYADTTAKMISKIQEENKGKKSSGLSAPPSPVSECDDKVPVVEDSLLAADVINGQGDNTVTESWMVPFEEEKTNNSENIMHDVSSTSGKTEERDSPPVEDSEIPTKLPPGGQDSVDPMNDKDIIRCNGPVIRMEYDGEMVSVSEQTAAKLQEGACDWV